MLKSWSVQNFKAIGDSGELQLAPVTVLAGLNSSGKTSLLQSILIVAQTLSNPVLDRALLPNGPIVQLGTFDEIVHRPSSTRTLRIRFELSIDEKDEVEFDQSGEPFVMPGPYTQSITATALFRGTAQHQLPSSAIEASKVHTERMSISITTKDDIGFPSNISGLEHTKLDFSFQELNDEEANRLVKGIDPEQFPFFSSRSQMLHHIGDFEPLSTKSSHGYLLTVSHFLPGRLIFRFSQTEKYKRYLSDEVYSLLNSASLEPATKRSPLLFRMRPSSLEQTRKALEELFRNNQLSGNFSGASFWELVQWYRSLKTLLTEEQFRTVQEDVSALVIHSIPEQDILKMMEDDESEEALDLQTYVKYTLQAKEELLARSVEHITKFFTRKIRYLGPLRADPQAAQKYPLSNEFDDVGSKGEYAAAVYEANQDIQIEWYNPFVQQVAQGTLREALDGWTMYLNVAQHITIETAGSNGFRWQVLQKPGQKSLPLASVGIGVSQVLPILVMGLISAAGTLLIIEQPELHLHPGLQARLGDFFLGLAKCHKQCLIETHSENLIHQLRFHIVQSDGQDKEEIAIYFVELDEQGTSHFTPIEISVRGNILNWPEGFFDETYLQQDRINEEILKRRERKTDV